MTAKWKQILAGVAPTLATMLGGPLAGVAANIAGKHLLGEEGTTAEQIKEAVIGVTSPEMLLKLKEIESELTKFLAQNNIDLEKVHADDRASARSMQIATKSKAPHYLAAVVVVGFFGILSALMFVDVPGPAIAPLNIMLGALAGGLVQVLNFYFGSSVGSKDKTQVIHAMARGTGDDNG